MTRLPSSCCTRTLNVSLRTISAMLDDRDGLRSEHDLTTVTVPLYCYVCGFPVTYRLGDRIKTSAWICPQPDVRTHPQNRPAGYHRRRRGASLERTANSSAGRLHQRFQRARTRRRWWLSLRIARAVPVHRAVLGDARYSIALRGGLPRGGNSAPARNGPRHTTRENARLLASVGSGTRVSVRLGTGTR